MEADEIKDIKENVAILKRLIQEDPGIIYRHEKLSGYSALHYATLAKNIAGNQCFYNNPNHLTNTLNSLSIL